MEDSDARTPSDNHLRRLAQAPKHHLADPALVARLLGRTKRHLLAGNATDVVVPRDGSILVDTAVVTIGPDAYRRRDGIAVVPLALLGA
jgi:hypothetical protein